MLLVYMARDAKPGLSTIVGMNGKSPRRENRVGQMPFSIQFSIWGFKLAHFGISILAGSGLAVYGYFLLAYGSKVN